MSRHHSTRHSNYGGDYDAGYDDLQDHRDGYHLPDPRETPRYKTDAYYDDPRDHHSNRHSKHIEDYDRWNIDSRDLNKWVPTDPWNHVSKNSGATYPHEGLARTGLRQRLGEGSEPFGRRGKKPVIKAEKGYPTCLPCVQADEPTRRETRVSEDFVPQSRHERPHHEPAQTRRRRTVVPTARASKRKCLQEFAL